MRDASVVRGIGVLPIFAGLIGLLLLIGSLAADLGAGRPVSCTLYRSQSGRIKPDTPSKAPACKFSHQKPLPDQPAPASSPGPSECV